MNAAARAMPAVPASWVARIEPSAATLVAIPTCRNVLLTPDAMPAACLTTPIAVDASGGFTRPAPMPATMKPGIRCVHSEAGSRPRMSSTPAPTGSSPGPTSIRAGTRAESRPAGIAASSVAPVIASSRSPVCRAE